MNATARILTAVPDPAPVPDPEPATDTRPGGVLLGHCPPVGPTDADVDSMVARIAAHAAAATAPHRIVASPDPAVVARVEAQARLDVEGLPRALYRIEDV